MSKIYWLFIVSLLLAGVCFAQKTAVTYESLTVSSSAVGLSTATTNPPSGSFPNLCIARIETNNIRFRADGPAPSTTEGVLVKADEQISINGRGNIENILFIATGSDAVIKVQCYV